MDTELHGDQEARHGLIYRHSEIIPGIGLSALWFGGMIVPLLLSRLHPVGKTAVFLGAVWGLSYVRMRLKTIAVTNDGVQINYPLRALKVFIALNEIELLVLTGPSTKYSTVPRFVVFTRGKRKEVLLCPTYHYAEQVIKSFNLRGVRCLNTINADAALSRKIDAGRHIPEALRRYKNM